MAAKVCPIARSDFRRDAKPIAVQIGNIGAIANVKEFSTGSLGFYANPKITLDIGGKLVEAQVGLNITIIGSKELPQS